MMHRQILGASKGENVDHIDGNGLNNQRSNLRFCTQSQNCCNQRKRTLTSSSKYKGVAKAKRKWHVCLGKDGITYNLGCFASQETAAREYDKLAKLVHGEFALLNFPEK